MHMKKFQHIFITFFSLFLNACSSSTPKEVDVWSQEFLNQAKVYNVEVYNYLSKLPQNEFESLMIATKKNITAMEFHAQYREALSNGDYPLALDYINKAIYCYHIDNEIYRLERARIHRLLGNAEQEKEDLEKVIERHERFHLFDALYEVALNQASQIYISTDPSKYDFTLQKLAWLKDTPQNRKYLLPVGGYITVDDLNKKIQSLDLNFSFCSCHCQP